MLMAMDPLVKELSVYDLTISMVPAEGVATDLSHLDRRCSVKAYPLDTSQKPLEHLKACLTGCSLVLVPNGVPRKPGQSTNDLLKINAGITKATVEACARYCPDAIIGLLVIPGNSVVPAMARLYEKSGLDPRKIVGITSVHGIRATKFVHEATKASIETIDVPVVGGCSEKSIVPLFSQVEACAELPQERLQALDQRLQEADAEVMKAKRGKGHASLSMGYAAARLGSAVLRGLAGERTSEFAYVKTTVRAGLSFFASKVTFGPKGVERVANIPSLISEYEKSRLDQANAQLAAEIEEGLKYAENTEMSKGEAKETCAQES
jgi:malate dehydrogenase